MKEGENKEIKNKSALNTHFKLDKANSVSFLSQNLHLLIAWLSVSFEPMIRTQYSM